MFIQIINSNFSMSANLQIGNNNMHTSFWLLDDLLVPKGWKLFHCRLDLCHIHCRRYLELVLKLEEKLLSNRIFLFFIIHINNMQ